MCSTNIFTAYSIYILLSDQTGTKHTFRSCSIAKSESVDPCAMADDVSKITKGQGKVDFCETCEKDLCNHSVRHSFTLTSVIVVPCFAIIISSWIGVWTNSVVSLSHNNVSWEQYWIEVCNFWPWSCLCLNYVQLNWCYIHYVIHWKFVCHWWHYFKCRKRHAYMICLILQAYRHKIIAESWKQCSYVHLHILVYFKCYMLLILVTFRTKVIMWPDTFKLTLILM